MPLRPEDHLAVIDLLASYARAIDSNDADAFADLFQPDAVLDLKSAGRRLEGREAIREWVAGIIIRFRDEPATHFVGLPQISGQGDRCAAQTYCVVLEYDSENNIRAPLVARYEDVCVKVGDRWRFQHRVIHNELHDRRT